MKLQTDASRHRYGALIVITPFALFPVLVVDDPAALKSFYETHFGFRSEFYQQDFYLHLKHPESSIQLGFMVPDHPDSTPITRGRVYARRRPGLWQRSAVPRPGA